MAHCSNCKSHAHVDEWCPYKTRVNRYRAVRQANSNQAMLTIVIVANILTIVGVAL